MTGDLDHALWIGGMTGGGKTTVARRLAQRWGLRLYSSDNWTWVHRDRAIAAGVEAAITFESLTPTKRDLVSAEERAAMWLGSERAAMVVDDVRALPRVPIVVAEGGVISPDVIPPTRAVWLAPTEEFQLRHRLVDWLAIGFSGDSARRCSIPTVAVDGQRSVQDVVDDVERAFAEHLTSGPLASSKHDRRKLLREANLAGVVQVRDGCARPWATADPEVQLRSFVCECASPWVPERRRGHSRCRSRCSRDRGRSPMM